MNVFSEHLKLCSKVIKDKQIKMGGRGEESRRIESSVYGKV